LVSTTISYQVYVTSRKLSKGDSSKYETKFANVPIPRLMRMWVKYRIDLELKSIEWQLSEAEKRLHYLKLLIRACDALDLIFKALRSSDPKAALVIGMKITEEEADMILNLKVRQLSKLDQDKLNLDVKSVMAKIKELNSLKKRPHLEVAQYLRAAASKLSLVSNDCSTQWSL
jgi:DNA gyrase/topoisomerase IV subunit A